MKLPVPTPSSNSRGLRILLTMVGVGLLIGALQPYGIDELLDLGQALADNPAYLSLVVLGMMLLFSFGLPGSLAVWLIAPFQPPLIATALLLVGSLGGALGAYRFSARFRQDWDPGSFERRVVELLSRHSGMLTQMALRILPGFPHAVVNFAGGVLGLGLPVFLTAATLGLAVKWSVYAGAIHGLVEAVEQEQALDWNTGVPLFVLALLLLVGAGARRRLLAHSPPGHRIDSQDA